MSPPMFSIY